MFSNFAHLFLLLSILILNSFASALPYGDDNNDIYTNPNYDVIDDAQTSDQQPSQEVTIKVPRIKSKPQRLLVDEGSTIQLPCRVDQTVGFVLMWRKDDKFISVAKQMVEKDARFSLGVKGSKPGDADSNTLVIANAKDEDAGNYTCQVSTYSNSEIKHSLRVRLRPEIKAMAKEGIIRAKTGESVTLECEVTRGHPTPEVKWYRHNNVGVSRKMPGGEDYIRGLSITFKEVTRHHSGSYICSANNGFGAKILQSNDTSPKLGLVRSEGTPAEAVIKLEVQHSPEIEEEETYIHTSEGDMVEIVCVVHASPRPDLTWYKDNNVLLVQSSESEEEKKGNDDKFIFQHIGNRYSILIPRVQQSDFGDYKCMANNTLGSDMKSATVSGKVGETTFISNPTGKYPNKYSLRWSVKSLTPVTEFKVKYRQADKSKDKRFQSSSNAIERHEAQSSTQFDKRNDWFEMIIKPTGTAEKNQDSNKMLTYLGQFEMKRLSPAVVYECYVSSKNSYGWNSYTDSPFKFATEGATLYASQRTSGASKMSRSWFSSTASMSFLTSTTIVMSLVYWPSRICGVTSL